MVDPATINPLRRLWAAVSPPCSRGRYKGQRWIDWSSLLTSREGARTNAARMWTGGWADLEQRGWAVARVDVTASEPGR